MEADDTLRVSRFSKVMLSGCDTDLINHREEWENRFTEESMSRHSLSSVDSDSVRRRSLALTTVQEEQKRIPGGWSPTFREIDLSAMESVESLDE